MKVALGAAMHVTRSPSGRIALGAALALGLAPCVAWAWLGVVDRPSDIGGSHVAYAPRGDVVVAGRTDVSGDQGLLSVAKFSRGGRLRWQTTGTDVLTADPASLAVDREGNVYVAGAVGGDDEDTFGPLTVIKFDATDGREAWRWRPDDQEGRAVQVATDDSGDVFVAGYLSFFDAIVGVLAKLDGASGVPLWLVEDPAGYAFAVATFPDGDVVALEAGEVRRRSGVNGDLMWQSGVAGMFAQWVAVDRHGDVIVVGAFGHLRKVDGDDGSLRWETKLQGFEEPVSRIHDIAVDRYGDVVVSGSVRGVDLHDFAVVKVAGTTGAELWRYVVERDGLGRAVAVAVDRQGDAFVTGQLEGYPSQPRFEVLQIDGSTGRVEWSRARSEIGGGADVAVDRGGHVAVSGLLVLKNPPQDDQASLVVGRLSPRGGGLTGPERRHGLHGEPLR